MSFKKFIPLLDRVLVERLSGPTQTAGGILLPQAKSASNHARVISVGTGAYKPDGTFTGTIVQSGDTVLISPTAKTQVVPVEDKTYYLLSESDIMGIIENK